MKRVIYILICLSLALACTQTEKSPNDSNVDAGKAASIDTAEYALPLDSAIAYTKRYDSIARIQFKGSVPIKAYTIRAIDLLEAVGVSKNTKVAYSHVRVYIGMDLNNNFRMFLTPVEDASIDKGIPGKDKILKGWNKHGSKNSDMTAVEGSYVLDFSSPCPATCPPDSPLNN